MIKVSQNGLNITIKDRVYLANLLFNFISKAKRYDSLIVGLLYEDTTLKINDNNSAETIKLTNRNIYVDEKELQIEEFIKKEIGKDVKYLEKQKIFLTEHSSINYIEKIIRKAKYIMQTTQPTKENREKIEHLEKQLYKVIDEVKDDWIPNIKKVFKESRVVQEAIEERVKKKLSNKTTYNKISKIDKLEIYKALRDAVIVENPSYILTDLGIDYKTLKGGNRLQFSLRDERTPSSFMEIRGGVWRWKDFGTDDGGTIIDIVKIYTNVEFKDALLYCVEKLGIHNPLDNINNNQIKKQIETIKSSSSLKAQNNTKKAPKQNSSKVVSVLPIQPDTIASKYLESRKIVNIPKGIYIIKGLYEDKDGNEKNIWGIGVLNVNGGADIHFAKKIGSLKSRVIGLPGITHIEGPNKDKVAIFEAKFDYAAIMQKYEKYFKDINIIIANSASNFRDVIEYIKDKKIGAKSISIFGQNDLAGATFDLKVAQGLENSTDNLYTIDYKQNRYGVDINDLLIENKLDCFEKDSIFTTFKITNSKQLEKRLEYIEEKKNKIEHKEESRVVRKNTPKSIN